MIPCDGLVLAGGQSRRMGRSKADLPMPDGRTLLLRAYDTLAQVCKGRVWISRPFGYTPSGSSDLVDQSPQPGPLWGIACALEKSLHELVAVLAVDLPLIESSLYEKLYRQWQANQDCDIIYAHSKDSSPQPLASLWHKRALPVIKELMVAPKTPRVQSVVATLKSQSLDVGSPHSLLNINTPQDWSHFEGTGEL